MPVEWRDYEFSSEGRLGEFKLYADFDEDNKQWFAISVVGAIAHFPTREAAKLAAEAEARRVLMQGLRELSPDHLGRTDQDFAIEFGEYLAKAAERFMDHHNSREYPSAAELDEGVDRWRALQAAIHEFRKRAERAALTAAMGGE